MMALAMTTVPAAHGGVVLGIIPLATTAAACVVASERPSAGFWLVSLAGAAIVIVFVLSQGDIVDAGARRPVPARNRGGGSLRVLAVRPAEHEPARVGGDLVAGRRGAAAVVIVSAIVLWPPDLSTVPPKAWAGLAYVSFVSQFLAFFVFNAAMAMAGVSRVGQLMLLQPFVIVALAALVNGEPIRLETLGYAAAVVATVMVGQRMRVRRG